MTKTPCSICKRTFSSRSIILIHGTLACRDCQNRISKGLEPRGTKMIIPQPNTDLILEGDCLLKLKDLPNESVDAIVTDPPYELGFMGKSWDNTGIANNKELWKECLRVLKPGAYLLSFGGTRTYHRMASAIEDAGFEIRDMIEWIYGSGFPKSLNISKAIDKMNGLEPIKKGFRRMMPDMRGNNYAQGNREYGGDTVPTYFEEPNSEQAKKWEGWGTALKPAHEPICMARKPLAEKTVAENCLKYGTGGINIDESRVEATKEDMGDWDRFKGHQNSNTIRKNMVDDKTEDFKERVDNGVNNLGRFPANLIHDGSEEVLKEFEKAGVSKGNGSIGGGDGGIWTTGNRKQVSPGFSDIGTPARFFKQCEFTEEDFEYSPFFYCAKASRSERNKGCEDMPLRHYLKENKMGGEGDTMLTGSGNPRDCRKHNNHPTVKPIALMEYLIKMVTPKGGVVLDPFAGSGTTLVASKRLGYKYIGIELTKEYIPIINARLESVK